MPFSNMGVTHRHLSRLVIVVNSPSTVVVTAFGSGLSQVHIELIIHLRLFPCPHFQYKFPFTLTAFRKLSLSVAAGHILLKGIVMLHLNGVVVIVFCLHE